MKAKLCDKCRLAPCQCKRAPLSPELRQRLEWSCDYSTAEALAEDTIRHNAQWIASGIPQGKSFSDRDLLTGFAEERLIWHDSRSCHTIDPEWALPAEPFFQELIDALNDYDPNMHVVAEVTE